TRCLIAAAISRVRAPSAAMTTVAARIPANAFMPRLMGATLSQFWGGPHVIRNPVRLDYYVDSVYKVVTMAEPPYLGEFELLVLLSVLRIAQEDAGAASGAAIARELEEEAGRRGCAGGALEPLDS